MYTGFIFIYRITDDLNHHALVLVCCNLEIRVRIKSE